MLLGAVVGVIYRDVARHLDEEHLHLLAEVVELARAAPAGTAAALEGSVSADAAAAVGVEKYGYRLVTAAGVTAESPGMARVPASAFAPVPVAGLSEPAAGRHWYSADGTHFLLGAAALPRGGNEVGPASVQVALDVTEDDDLLVELRLRALALLALGVVASGLAGAAIARHSLRPIERLTEAMAAVSARRLDARFDSMAFPLELRRLAGAFSEMLDRLDRAFADISAYSGNLAHELRTPLGNLRGETEVALLRARTADEYREVLASSLEELGRLARMVDALLFLARADRRETVVASAPVELGTEVRGVVDYHAAVAEENGVALRASGTAVAEVDAELFRRALSNLLSNALRHVARGGSVAVDVAAESDGWAVVTVRDDGCGIAAGDLPRVAERFYRGSPPAGGDAGGSGLGLAIVRSIVELHGGRLGITSAPGAGTAVTMRFPLRQHGSGDAGAVRR